MTDSLLEATKVHNSNAHHLIYNAPPNGTYGFRTKKTLSDPKIWYAANRASGHDLLVAGAVITASSVGMLFLGTG